MVLEESRKKCSRIANEKSNNDFEIVAINARADAKTLAHLFKYDSCYGIFKRMFMLRMRIQ